MTADRPSDEQAATGPRRISDPKVMRALAHPVRLALLETLDHAGPLTATEAGEMIGESPSSCSFHLRQLAKYGFVEEAENPDGGRRRPWRTRHRGMRFTDVHDDEATVQAAIGLERVLRDRYLARAQAGLVARGALAPAWRESTGMTQTTLYVTVDEMQELQEEILTVVARYRDRVSDRERRPAGVRAIEYLGLAYPVEPGTAV